MLRAAYSRYVLQFREPATTSRETMTTKETFFLRLWHSSAPDVYGIGECAIFRGLSADDTPDYEARLARLCAHINRTGSVPETVEGSSLRFGLEGAVADLEHGGGRCPFPSAWSEGLTGIVINGLVWMGSIEQMCHRVEEKLKDGFSCVKFKIGGQDFDREVEMIRQVRERYPATQLEIRLDANGAFTPTEALHRLERLAELDIHSIEQPIKPRQWSDMSSLCRQSPIPIALDEELIGLDREDDKRRMLEIVQPRYLILKPALCGGFSGADEWIALAGEYGASWWATSALESNIGLNAIAQWVSNKEITMPQGLGTGHLYTNNIPSPLYLSGQTLRYGPTKRWHIPDILWTEPE